MDDIEYETFDDDDLYSEYDIPDHQSNMWYQEEEDPEVTATELWNLCLQPTLRDGSWHAVTLLLWALVFRLSSQTLEVSSTIQHALSACTGLLALQHFFHSKAYYVLAFGAVSYCLLLLAQRCLRRWRAFTVSLLCIVILLVCELAVVDSSDWHKLRGAQMLVAMKVMSVAFDLEIGTLQTLPSTIEFAGYIFSIGTCVFGPWVSYREYLSIYKKPAWSLRWIVRVLLSLAISIFFLTVSTCWIHWMIPDDSWRWWVAYRDALSFRSSHYFVSYLSESSAVMAGHGVQEDLSWSFPVSKPHVVELPRSLVQVVVSWNVPMHYFLKNYVFRTTRPLGGFCSVLATYGVSALLHGLNFQLAAVLLSLGVYTYVEHQLRAKLATVFSACVAARPCRPQCAHTHGASHPAVWLANLGFGVLATFHLTYLGVMFTSDTTLEEQGYSYTHALGKWRQLGFASHWLALFTFVFYLLI